MKYIDSHCHYNPAVSSATTLLASMDAAGIEISYLVGGGLLPPLQIAEQILNPPIDGATKHVHFDNLTLLAACQTDAYRLRPFYFVNPWHPPSVFSDIKANFCGLKFAGAIHGLQYEFLAPWFATAQQAAMPVYTHCLQAPGFTVTDLVKLVKNFPDLPVILGHGGVSQMDLSALTTIRDAANIFIETSGTFSSFVRFAVNMIGDDRILFGSEYPLQSPKAEIVKIETSGISEKSLNKIARENAAKLFSHRNPKQTKNSSTESGVAYAH